MSDELKKQTSGMLVIGDDDKSTFVKEVQFEKHDVCMLVTELGKLILVSPDELKQFCPRVLTFPEKGNAFKLLQLSKQLLPNDVTELASVTDDNNEQLLKQKLGKLLTDDGMLIVGKDVHESKQLLPKLVTVGGIMTDDKNEQALKQ
jgi:hypothetical protein